MQTTLTESENVLNEECVNVREWFVDNELSIHFGEDKTTYILFSRENLYDNNRTKFH